MKHLWAAQLRVVNYVSNWSPPKGAMREGDKKRNKINNDWKLSKIWQILQTCRWVNLDKTQNRKHAWNYGKITQYSTCLKLVIKINLLKSARFFKCACQQSALEKDRSDAELVICRPLHHQAQWLASDKYPRNVQCAAGGKRILAL